MATMMVATAPILFVYPFLQRYFVKGMLLGSIKG
jgi:putative aldouronate transport system permease protein